ncbi:2TM domain-containing protein [uncultured Dokdonia sp.]|uniref:2TM domain-containing protein n=1 Tax=uncultured Dokdonia sp. TaxID=575653 RepID=UPI00260FD908|nr:2TM domain-containing protein [uncultured Dokdonia sp.]
MEHIDQEKLERAKQQVRIEKEWYTHLFIYLVMNIVLQLLYAGIFDGGKFTDYIPWWVRITTPFFWGLNLFIHWFYAFKKLRFDGFYKKWEARKIKEYMEEEEKDFTHTIRKYTK